MAGRSDKGKAILHTIDPDFILGIGRISEFGARKYHMRNFLMAPGMEWSRVYESLLRHLFLWWGGEELDIGPGGEFGPTDDPETDMKWSGMPHLLHVAWNVMVLYTYSHRAPYQPGDDRPGVIEYDDGDWKEWRAEFDIARDQVNSARISPETISNYHKAKDISPPMSPLFEELKDKRERELALTLGVLGNFADGTGEFTQEDAKRAFQAMLSMSTPGMRIKAPQFINDPVRRAMVDQNREGKQK